MLRTLGLLPEPVGRLRSFISSLVLNVSIGVLLLWFTVTQLRKAPVPPRYVTTQLIFPSKLPRQHKKLPPPHPAVELPRKIETQPPKPEPVKPVVVHMETPAMPTMPSVQAAIVAAPARPKVGLFASAKRSTPATNDRAPAIKTGGFGDPSGVAVNPNAARPATIAAIGRFEIAPGTRQGKASPHAGLVAAGGFGSGLGNAPKGTGLGGGTVATGGFGGNGTSSSIAPEPRIQQVHFSPLKSCLNLVRNTRKRRGNYGSRAKSRCKFALASTAKWRFCASSPVLAMALIKRLRWLPNRSGLNLQ
jgi:hypothetical protein